MELTYVTHEMPYIPGVDKLRPAGRMPLVIDFHAFRETMDVWSVYALRRAVLAKVINNFSRF